MFKPRYTTLHIDLDNVNSIGESYMLGGGIVVIETLGDDFRIAITEKENARKIAQDLSNLIMKLKSEKNQPTQVIQQVSAPDEIRKYKALLDEGLISQEEFEAKKKQLLGL